MAPRNAFLGRGAHRAAVSLVAAILALLVPHARATELTPARATVLVPDAVWDGIANAPHAGWVVVVRGPRIEAVGPEATIQAPADAERVVLSGATLLPGLIEGHAHLFLHPYNETLWDDQVLKEPYGLRMARAVAHARASLEAGITAVRDLGTEGAFDGDVQLKRAIEQGIVPGPRILTTTRAIVATGSYGPGRLGYAFDPPQGAEEASGAEEVARVVRSQIGHGADWIKVYADYRWGPKGEARPTFSQDELKVLVETARTAGRPVSAHAASPEGMRRAALAGVETIEHGNEGTPEVFRLMKQKGVAFCPTLAASEAYATYFDHWVKGRSPLTPELEAKRKSFRAALAEKVDICFGGDVGVFAHGDNVRELELMVEYGMSPLAALRSATSGNARIFHLDDRLGRVASGYLADLIAVDGDPTRDVSVLRGVRLVMKDGLRVPIDPRRKLTGMFRYMADAARFRDCHSGRQWPVAMTEGYPVLERAYGEHSPAPGGELLVTVIGRIDQRPKMEGAGTEPTLVVEQFVEAVLGSGCEPGGSREALAHNRWRPIRIGGRTVEVAGREREPWIHFESTTGRVTGFGGCNRITGTYTDHGDSLRVGPLASSRMACPSMDTENAFLKALDATRHYRVEGRTLELLDERGKVLALLEERNLR